MNITRILVPLDGSRLAETVLPAATSMAEQLGAQVLLLHVLERQPPTAVHGEAHLRDARSAWTYLEREARPLREHGPTVEIHVHEPPVDDVPSAIHQHAREFGADLIAMCAHGRSSVRVRLIGSNAERILREGSVPILLRTAHGSDTPSFELRKLLVPLDFGHDVEAALCAARMLARHYGATVILLSAPEPPPPPTSQLLPETTALTHEFDREDLSDRLDALAFRLRADVGDVQTIVADDYPTDAILSAAASLPADVIVLVTDAHGGLSTWYHQSTGQRLLARPALTLLLIKQG